MSVRPVTGALLIFDLDGTLFHTETVTVPAARAAFEAQGLAPPPAEAVCPYIGRTSAEYVAWLETLCPPDVARSIVRDAVERELVLIPRAGRVYPGVPAALAELVSAGATLALCSNGSAPYVEAVLHAHDLAGFFAAVRPRRPKDTAKPRMVGELIERLAPGPDRRGAVIGDRIDDMEAARTNGLRAIGCGYGYAGEGELDDADAVVAHPADLPATVRRLL